MIDPFLAKAISSLATSLGNALGQTAKRRLGNAILGPPEERALIKACQAAVERAVAETAPPGLTGREVAEVLTMVEQLVKARIPDGIPMTKPLDLSVAVAQWREAAEDFGIDPPTFLVTFDRLIEALLQHIPDECRRAAAQPSNALFAGVLLANLNELNDSLAAVHAELGSDRLAGFLPLNPRLNRYLENARKKCIRADRQFFTADLLLSLFASTRVSACFNSVQLGLADQIRAELRRYIDALDHTAGSYRDFHWAERPEIRRAQQLAWQEGKFSVDDLHLLLGVLDGSSPTSQQLRGRLGVNQQRLRDVVVRAAVGDKPNGTPGTILGGQVE